MAKYTFDLNKLTVADYLALVSCSKLSPIEQAQTMFYLAQKACADDIDIYAEPFTDVESIMMDFASCLETHQAAKDTPPTFWKWGQDES